MRGPGHRSGLVLKAVVILACLIMVTAGGVAQQQRVSLAGTTLVFAGIRGNVVALDRGSGKQVWSTHLGGGDFVNLVFSSGDLYASTRGEIFCIEAATGTIRWHNALKGYGRGLATIAGFGIGEDQSAAARAKKRKEEEAASTYTAPVIR